MARKSKYYVAPPAAAWRAGLYLRLSRDDGERGESESIASQKAILEDYVSERPEISIVDFYVDDGWSGTDFDRPDFQRMISDIAQNKINCVICKDLSRLGRNYVEAGKYLEVIFPMFKVRFIAVNDFLDSFSNPASLNSVIVPFKNVLNDEYCRDISQKVRTALDARRRGGKFIGSFALYGYQKDLSDRNKLVVDPEAAQIVRLIFQKFLGGEGILAIARALNLSRVPCPLEYKRIKGLKVRPNSSKSPPLWQDRTVRRILTNEMYIGNLVQKRCEVISYKVHLSRPLPEDKWIKVEGTHEAIISKSDFLKVKELLARDMRASPKSGKLSLFSGFLKCPDCGRAMQKRTLVGKRVYEYYFCGTYRKMRGACTKHMIRADVLEEAVLAAINKYIRLAVDFERLLKKIAEFPAADGKKARLEEAISACEREKAEAERMALGLYPDFKEGLLNRGQYLALKEKYENIAASAGAEILRLKADLAEAERGKECGFLATFKKYRALESLNRGVLSELVDVIYVHEGGAVEIYLKCRDEFERAAEYIVSRRALLSGEDLSDILKNT